MDNNYALGVDIGGTNTAFGLVDRKGNLHFEHSVPTSLGATPEELVAVIHDELKNFSTRFNLVGIGIVA